MKRYRRLLEYARPQRRFFLLIFVLTLIASAFVAIQPWPMKLVVDYVLSGRPFPRMGREMFAAFGLDSKPVTILPVAVLGSVAIYAISSVLEAVLTWSWTLAGRRVVYDLAEDLYARMQRRSILFHQRLPVGDVLGAITVDCWSVHKLLDLLLFAPAHALLTIILMLVLMAQLDPLLTLLALAIAPFMVAASFLIGRPLRAAARLKREIEIRIQSHVQQTLTGIPVVQAFAQEERAHAQFEEFADAAVRAEQRTALVGSINALSSGLVTTIGTGIILWVGSLHVLAAKLTIGDILLFLVYLTSLQAQMKVFATMYTALQGFRPSVDRVLNVLEAAPEVSNKPDARVLKRASGALQFENVTFGYEPGSPVLRDISFTLLPGETIAIVGSTGAGKSTLANLIPRFFDPSGGRVLLDGIDLRDLEIGSLRQQVSLVLQEPFLFPFNVAENIAYGRPEASRTEIESAARLANAHGFISQLPKGYETVLAERGGSLSGGERQRLSIARAILKDSPILILDEPTSAIDLKTEHSLLEALDHLRSGRTTIIIGHRLSTVRLADRIIVLDHGRVAEIGTHDELLAKSGIYAGFHGHKFGTTRQAVPG